MDKLAQTTKPKREFKDPIRKKIEEDKSKLALDKKKWNEAIKAFNKELKNMKSALHGNIQGQERIHLDEKLPEDLSGKLLQLAEYFNAQAAEAAKLVTTQSQIAERSGAYFAGLEAKRNQKKQKDMPKAAGVDYNLISEAISPKGLWWQKVRHYFSSQEEKARVKALDRVFNLDKLYSNAEAEVLKITSREGFKSLDSIITKITSETNNVRKQINVDKQIRDEKAKGVLPASGNEPGAENKTVISNKEIYDRIMDEMAAYDRIMVSEKIRTRINKNPDKAKLIQGLRLNIENKRTLLEKKTDKIDEVDYIPGLIELYNSLATNFSQFIDGGSALDSGASEYKFFNNNKNKIFGITDTNSADTPYEPIFGTKSIRRKFLLGFNFAEDKKIFYDLFRAGREILVNVMKDLEQGLNIDAFNAHFNRLHENNLLLQKKINLMMSTTYTGTEEEEEKARAAAGKSWLRQQARKALGLGAKEKDPAETRKPK